MTQRLPCFAECTDPNFCRSAVDFSECDDCSVRCPMREGAMCQECGCYEDCCDCTEFSP